MTTRSFDAVVVGAGPAGEVAAGRLADGGLDVAIVECELVGGEALRRRDEVIHDRDDASQLPWLEDRGITLVRGSAVLDGERRVRVGDDVLGARRAVVLATGSAATLPPVDGLQDAATWTTR